MMTAFHYKQVNSWFISMEGLIINNELQYLERKPLILTQILISWSNRNLEMLVFVESGKAENPGENPSEQGDNQQQTQPTYDLGPESNPCHHS